MLARMLALFTVGAVSAVRAHIGAFHEAMFCINGLSNEDQQNNNVASDPLMNKSWDDFWMHGKCKDYPPAEGKFLEIPAGGKATLEHAGNRGQTSLSFDGRYSGLWPDGEDRPYDRPGGWDNSCIFEPNLHTENRTRAAGTALAIAYKSNIHDVKYEDLVIMSILPETPWHRIAQYDIPADLPACDDCICAFSWIPNHCGIPNMYMNAFRCRVTGAKANAPKLAKAQPAVWCEDDQTRCKKGAKGITIYNQQKEINTISLFGVHQKDTQEASPGYNTKMGFSPGAQNDIFEHDTPASPNSPSSDSVEPTPTPEPSSTSPTPTSTPNPKQTRLCNLKRRSSGHHQHRRRISSFFH